MFGGWRRRFTIQPSCRARAVKSRAVQNAGVRCVLSLALLSTDTVSANGKSNGWWACCCRSDLIKSPRAVRADGKVQNRNSWRSSQRSKRKTTMAEERGIERRGQVGVKEQSRQGFGGLSSRGGVGKTSVYHRTSARSGLGRGERGKEGPGVGREFRGCGGVGG